ncbi:UDP-glycosyltransferase [Tibeticola sp.]|uniref:UDP-glycosyltransferase n=1 Tax=Tibeticola sp. TaxID=2005368 RepID=UPI0025829FBB|nr:UDP-glycosyltransferase [Tibeticola sp.]MCI4440796.1 UDP-glycosyltransferase [Tibeticola sp.]
MKRRPLWLFVCYGGGHVQALLPVAERVRSLGLAEPHFLALTTAAPLARARGFPTLGFRDLVEPGDRHALQIGERLAAQLSVQATDRDESVAYLGLSYADLEQRLGAAEAAERYARYGRQAFLPLGILERALRRLQPALVLATNSPRAEQAAIESARALGIPSVCLLDLFGIWERERLARADYADALCVLNDAVRERFIAAGRPAEHIFVTGNPAFDGLRNPMLPAQGAALRRAAGWEDLHVLLLATSPEPERIPGIAAVGDPQWPRRIEQRLIEIVQANPRLALWLRRHPSEPPADAVAALGYPRIRVAGPEVLLHAWLHAGDEVLVTVSTVGVEAALCGRPVTQIHGSILDELSPYVEMGLAQRALGLEALAGAWSGAWAPRAFSARTGVPLASPPAAEAVVAVAQRLVDPVAGAA